MKESETAADIQLSPAGADTNQDHDVELQKPLNIVTDLGDEGAKRIELMQQVWGKNGKLWIFVCLGICVSV